MESEEVLNCLEQVEEQEKYKQQLYNALNQMYRFAEEDLYGSIRNTNHVETGNEREKMLKHDVQELYTYKDILDTLEQTENLNQFVKNIRRKIRLENHVKQRYKRQLIEKVENYAEKHYENMPAGQYRPGYVEETVETARKAVEQPFIYEDLVASILGPATELMEQE